MFGDPFYERHPWLAYIALLGGAFAFLWWVAVYLGSVGA